MIWEAQFSILRYLAPLELLCGAVLLPPAAQARLRAMVAAASGFGGHLLHRHPFNGLPGLGTRGAARRSRGRAGAAFAEEQSRDPAGFLTDGLCRGLRLSGCPVRRREQHDDPARQPHGAGEADRDGDPFPRRPPLGARNPGRLRPASPMRLLPITGCAAGRAAGKSAPTSTTTRSGSARCSASPADRYAGSGSRKPSSNEERKASSEKRASA